MNHIRENSRPLGGLILHSASILSKTAKIQPLPDIQGKTILWSNSVATYTVPSCGSGHALLCFPETKKLQVSSVVGTLNIQSENSNVKSRIPPPRSSDRKQCLNNHWSIPPLVFFTVYHAMAHFLLSAVCGCREKLQVGFKDNKASFKVSIFFSSLRNSIVTLTWQGLGKSLNFQNLNFSSV